MQILPTHFLACQALLKVMLKRANLTIPINTLLFNSFRSSLGSLVMRADIQRKPLGFQEVTASIYRCVVDLMKLYEALTHSLVFKTKGFLEQPFSTSLLQSIFKKISIT